MPPGPRRWRERDDGHLVKPAGPLADLDPLEELIRVVNEAQERDAEDERRLHHALIFSTTAARSAVTQF